MFLFIIESKKKFTYISLFTFDVNWADPSSKKFQKQTMLNIILAAFITLVLCLNNQAYAKDCPFEFNKPEAQCGKHISIYYL